MTRKGRHSLQQDTEATSLTQHEHISKILEWLDNKMAYKPSLYGCTQCDVTSPEPFKYEDIFVDHTICGPDCFGCKAKGLQMNAGDAKHSVVASGTTQKKWDKELAFAYDIQHPTKVQIALGGVIGPAGKWYPQIGAIAPSQVTVASGKVAYQLWSLDPVTQAINTEQKGLMIVQMTDDTHIKVEMFADVKISDAAFTSNAKIYAR